MNKFEDGDIILYNYSLVLILNKSFKIYSCFLFYDSCFYKPSIDHLDKYSSIYTDIFRGINE